MRRLFWLPLLLVACVPAIREYEAGKLVSQKYTFKAASKEKPQHQSVEHVFFVVSPSGLLQKNKQAGVEKKTQAPIGLTLFCPSGSGTVRTLSIIPHAAIPIFIWPLVWYPVQTKIYCAKSEATSQPTSEQASSQPKNSTPEEEAATLFNQAEIDYKLLKYESALENYQKAYEKVQSPELLFNIAQCYRLLERYKEALTTYETFLRESPDTPNRAEVEQLIAQTKKQLKQQQKGK